MKSKRRRVLIKSPQLEQKFPKLFHTRCLLVRLSSCLSALFGQNQKVYGRNTAYLSLRFKTLQLVRLLRHICIWLKIVFPVSPTEQSMLAKPYNALNCCRRLIFRCLKVVSLHYHRAKIISVGLSFACSF